MATEYVTREEFDALAAYVQTINSCKCDHETLLQSYLTKSEAARTYVDISNYNAVVGLLSQRIGTLPEDTEATTIVEYVDEKTANAGGSAAPEYKLPYTASEVAEKLGKI